MLMIYVKFRLVDDISFFRIKNGCITQNVDTWDDSLGLNG